jgi:hypothetical protein
MAGRREEGTWTGIKERESLKSMQARGRENGVLPEREMQRAGREVEGDRWGIEEGQAQRYRGR